MEHWLEELINIFNEKELINILCDYYNVLINNSILYDFNHFGNQDYYEIKLSKRNYKAEPFTDYIFNILCVNINSVKFVDIACPMGGASMIGSSYTDYHDQILLIFVIKDSNQTNLYMMIYVGYDHLIESQIIKYCKEIVVHYVEQHYINKIQFAEEMLKILHSN